MGISGQTLDWFQSYLSGRSQRVLINGELSDSRSIDISVLQGSILGPILFLVMINDLPNSTSLFTSIFADDTQGLARGKDLPKLFETVNKELKNWSSWFRAYKLKVNTSKTKYLVFHTKGKAVKMEGLSILFDYNEPLTLPNPLLISTLERVHNLHPNKESRSYKLLGIEFDENLTFNSQFQTLHAKFKKSIFCINKVKNFLPQKALKTLYHSLFHSHLNYCSSIYSCTSKSNIHKLLLLQKKIIRIITNSSYSAHTEPLFQKLNILPLEKVINCPTYHSYPPFILNMPHHPSSTFGQQILKETSISSSETPKTTPNQESTTPFSQPFQLIISQSFGTLMKEALNSMLTEQHFLLH
jgi:hypothetical protein